MPGPAPAHPSRRQVLAAAPAAALLAGFPALAAPGLRVVSLDYGLASTLMALGLPPVGISERSGWDEWVVEPALPPDVRELGISSEPNLEVLAQLAPDLILVTPFLDAQIARLERYAPVLRLETFIWNGRPILDACISATLSLAERIDRRTGAEQLLAAMEALFAGCRARLARHADRPVVLAHFWDARHVRISGDPSLFNDVLTRIGLRNAWDQPTGAWGFQTVPVEELSGVADPDAMLLIFDPLPAGALEKLSQSPLWRALPLTAPGRVRRMEPVLLFGMVNEAMRFARSVTAAMEAG
ncbi:iron-siderophore ABC transporter substrate-binding protein [Pseudogemmobacter sonorensis]|uniref:iron-siderophore ABC transporter substrate-binding protein n=1 Tax=Pseudogemmobacter sonorensis TaxID=2989681 RepID=UPI0036A3BB56